MIDKMHDNHVLIIGTRIQTLAAAVMTGEGGRLSSLFRLSGVEVARGLSGREKLVGRLCLR